MGLFKKKTIKGKIARKKVNFAGESMDKLDEEGNLPFGWVFHNQKYVNMVERDLQPFRQAINIAETETEMYAALKSFILFLQDGKVHYYKISECVGKYFEEYICDSMEAKQRYDSFEKLDKKINSHN